jgi:glycosyltransferase involved in cell wall biosynthesis
MQGVLSSMGPNSLRGMSIKEMISTIGPREIIKRSSIFSIARSFFEDGKIEDEMIRKSAFIITQSDWTDAQIRPVNPKARLYRTHRVLREDFIKCEKWTCFKREKPVIYSSAIGYSFKGLHILIKAIALVKMQYPNVMLRLAGPVGRRDILGDGYFRLILRMIKNYNLENNVTWLGSITAPIIIENLQQASVFVNPSYVESYSAAFAEAMSVGTPSVVSFSGAMPELAINNKEALFFTPGDYKRCAHLIIKLMSDNTLSEEISKNAVIRSEERNVKFDIMQEQIEIYNAILKQAKQGQDALFKKNSIK